MSNIYRIALVGAGIAERQAQGLSWLKDKFEIVQLCSLDRERGEKVCASYGIPEYGQDFEALLTRDDIDIISICTPPYLHYQMTEKVLLAGKHAICEKPLFGSLAECDQMEKLSARTGKIVMPIFQYRYGKGLQKLKRLIAEGLAGRPFMTTIETHWWRPQSYFDVEWRGKWATELGGGFLGHAIHAHDMLTYVHGPVAEVSAMGGPLMNDIEVEDNMVASVRMQNGSYAALSMSLSSRKEISRLRWCFEDLTVESDLSPYTMYREPWFFTGKDEAHQKRIDELLADYAHHEDGYSRQYELLYDALEKGAPAPVTIADGRHALELVAAAYLSERTGQRVSLPIAKDHPIYNGWNPA
ncbi:Gfo/Idh/MocA family oxidoreductase [Paracoccus sp. S3-43]|uniref:Gfo/Idh/MocA family protein n=1 Tax=Paracoccus sp. S3-43 TaxID=3030011 RepID=UPI0023AF1A07|nr:Gfo/Idh/MocA family oxidoreductase [Paracoccus sp. S3-43]WEF25161.1 Gfo/Idh/MocA family oxidoreductase [Paracoccus sp. S3-43]